MAVAIAKKRKKKKGNPFVNYFRNFGLKQISELGILIGAVVMFVGFFVPQIVQAIGMCIVTAAALCGILRAALIVAANKKERKSPIFKSGVSMLVFWAVLVIIGVLGIIFYFV